MAPDRDRIAIFGREPAVAWAGSERQPGAATTAARATVTLHLMAKQAPAPAAERAGFLGGLSDGWAAFGRTVGWLLTALGAVLPFLLLVVPAALVGRWVVRRSRRPGTAATPPPSPAAGPATG